MSLWTVLRGIGVAVCFALTLLFASGGDQLIAGGFCGGSERGCTATVPGFWVFVAVCLMIIALLVAVLGLCLLRPTLELASGLTLILLLGLTASLAITYFVY